MKLLALVFILSALSSLSVMEVVDYLHKSCPKFFIRRKTPTTPKWGDYKKICQRWEDQYQFATLYDIRRRIPVYSAYTVNSSVKTNRKEEWKNEPQLEDRRLNKNMIRITDEHTLMNYNNQALYKDYKASGYTRGHVFPNLFAGNQDQAESTFTFTNVAPQTNASNNKWAAQVEEPLLKDITMNCSLSLSSPAYIVTGVVPGSKWMAIIRNDKLIKEGINIPSYYWTAYCCIKNNGWKKKVRMSNAYLAQQNTESQNIIPERMTVLELNEKLSELYKTKSFRVFGNIC